MPWHMKVKYSTGSMEWFDNELLLHNPHLLKSKEFEQIPRIIEVQQEEELFGMDCYNTTYYATEILDAKYEKLKLMRLSTSLIPLPLSKRRT
jgi:hypothetical protein